jgi:hypothetical protein
MEMASDGRIYLPNFVTIGLNVQVILRLLPQKSERLVTALLLGEVLIDS